MGIQEIVDSVKALERRGEKLQRQINELEDAAATSPQEDQVLAQIPLLAESIVRGLLETEIKKWKRVCAVLSVLAALALGGLLLAVLF